MSLEELREIRKNRVLTKEEKGFYCRLWALSGLSKRAFCEREGLARTTFSNWFVDSLEEACHEEKENHFVPVQVISKEGVEEDTAKSLTFSFSNGLSVTGTFKRDELWKWLKEVSDAIASIRR